MTPARPRPDPTGERRQGRERWPTTASRRGVDERGPGAGPVGHVAWLGLLFYLADSYAL